MTTLLTLPPGAFRPTPKVRSAVVRLAFRPPPTSVTRPELLVPIVRSVFTQRRKTLANALAPFASARGLSAQALLAAAGIDGKRRPETLSLEELPASPTRSRPPDRATEAYLPERPDST